MLGTHASVAVSRQISPASQPALSPVLQGRGVVSTSPSPAEPPEPVTLVEPPELTLWSLEVVALVTLLLALAEPPALVVSVLLVSAADPAGGLPSFSDLPQARTANPTRTAAHRSRTRRG